MSAPDAAAELTALAGWIAEQLGDETADRRWIAESAEAKVRDIAMSLIGHAELKRLIHLREALESGPSVSDADQDDHLEHDSDERRRLKTRLLAELPRPVRDVDDFSDIDVAVADVLAAIPGDVCLLVTHWLMGRPAPRAPAELVAGSPGAAREMLDTLRLLCIKGHVPHEQ